MNGGGANPYSTSSSLIAGVSMSLSSRTSGEPYLSWTTAFMVTSSLASGSGSGLRL